MNFFQADLCIFLLHIRDIEPRDSSCKRQDSLSSAELHKKKEGKERKEVSSFRFSLVLKMTRTSSEESDEDCWW